MSQIVEFYCGTGTDAKGRLLDDFFSWNDDKFEGCHDHIQWMFPSDVPSNYNRHAPVLTEEDVALLRSKPVVQTYLTQAFLTFLQFAGLEWREGMVVKAANFNERRVIWKTPNHNWPRMTRVLRCLRLLEDGDQAMCNAYYKCLKALRSEGLVSADSERYWDQAMAAPIGKWNP
jgi:hypothetical protein